MPIAAAQPSSVHLHHDAAGRRDRIRHGSYLDRSTELLEEDRAHHASFNNEKNW
jgi:hypothetical protein